MYQSEQVLVADHLTGQNQNQSENNLSVVSVDAGSRTDQSLNSEKNSTLVRRLNNLFQALPGAVVMLDGEGRVVQCNPAANDLLGEPLENEHWRDVVDRAFSPRWDDGHDISLVNGRVVNISTQPMIDEPGQILLIKDVTETRQLQEQLNRAKRLSAKGEMAAALAHQIRTPLSSAILYLSNLSHKKLDQASREKFITKSLARLNYLEKLIEDMLLFARGGNFEMQEFSLLNLIEMLNQQTETQIEESGINFIIDPEIVDCSIMINPEAMISILENLIVNAIQASNEDGTIYLTAKIIAQNNEKVVRISLADNGSGIPENIRATLFEPFVTSRANGTGLGLSVVQAVVRSHGGGISVRDAEPQGTIFDMTLPIIGAMK